LPAIKRLLRRGGWLKKTAFQAQKKKVEFFTQKAPFWVVFKVLWGQKALSEAFLRQNRGKVAQKGVKMA